MSKTASLSQSPLRVVVLYSAGHLGSAIILNRLLDAPEYQVVGIVKARAIPFSWRGFARMRKQLGRTGWLFGWLMLWQQAIQCVGYLLGTLVPFARRRLAPGWLIASERGIPVFECQDVNDPESCLFMRGLCPDVLISAYFPQILKSEVLSIPRRGALNVHPGWLPAYRGAMCYFWVLRNMEDRGGVSVHWMDTRIDEGTLLTRRRFRLPSRATQQRVLVLSAAIGAHLLRRVGKALLEGRGVLPLRKKPSEKKAYFPMPTEQDFRAYFERRRFFRIRDILGLLLRDLRKPALRTGGA